jgi:hypothetical protein
LKVSALGSPVVLVRRSTIGIGYGVRRLKTNRWLGSVNSGVGLRNKKSLNYKNVGSGDVKPVSKVDHRHQS